MIDKHLVLKALQYLEEQGWSNLIDERQKNDVIKEITNNFPDINEETLNAILNVVIWQQKSTERC